MITPLPFLLSASALLFADEAALELRYKGRLEQVSRTEANAEVKAFDVYCLIQGEPAGAKVAFLIDEPGGGWAWPERFGEIALNEKLLPADAGKIQVLYNHEGTFYPLPLRQPLFEYADKLKADAAWKAGQERYEVVRATNKNGRLCFEVDVFTNIGKRQTVWVEETTGLVVAARSKVTMGRGDQFELLWELDSLQEADAKKFAGTKNAVSDLLQLQKDLKRKENATKPELSKAQLTLTADALPSLSKTAKGTPFEKLVAAIGEDLKQQTQRDDDVDSLAKRIIGKEAPSFSLKDLSGKTIDSKDLAGEIVVLHFWKYHDEPLSEPYGQVAYLDFLLNKREKLGVNVIGIAVDPRTENPAELNQAKRDFRKFRDFMNLSYPIALNSGTLLKTLGDPRTVEAPLPLWVVIDHKGKVVHYKSGYYEIHPEKGLEELDNVVIPLIRERRAEKIKATE